MFQLMITIGISVAQLVNMGTLSHVAGWRVSLAAARAAKSCAAGQQKIGKAPRSADPVPKMAGAAQAPEKPKRRRKTKAPEVDPEKDKLLVNAFADAIKQAAAQMGGGS